MKKKTPATGSGLTINRHFTAPHQSPYACFPFVKRSAAIRNPSGGGYCSGLLSFLKVSDRAAGAIKSGGTTRRAAKMGRLDMDHPEIQDFINWNFPLSCCAVTLLRPYWL